MNIRLPEIEELTEEQIKILDIEEPIAIYGGAGTGKTILSIWKHILNWKERDIKSFLITYTHTLTRYFELSIANKNLEASKFIDNIDSFKNRYYSDIDMLIIDEAQDIPEDIHIKLENRYRNISYTADNNQILYPNRQTTEQELNQIYKNRTFTLSQNFRNSYEILEFVKNIFLDNRISNKIIEYAKYNRQIGQKPILFYSNRKRGLTEYLIKLLKRKRFKQKKSAILVPTTEMFDEYKKILDEYRVEYSSYNHKQKGDIRFKHFLNIHLTTFKSSKGLEFDTVIIPEFQQFKYWSSKDLNSPINRNDYYVGMTRAREQLFLLSNNRNILNGINPNLYDIKDI